MTRLISALIVSLLLAAASAAQTYEIVHAFLYAGGQPTGSLVRAADGNFYGTTTTGGKGMGTIFKIDSSGTLTILHTFAGPDGANPQAPILQASNGFFYGTTTASGPNGSGTIFRMDSAGNVTTLQNFGSAAPLIQATDGFLYGTTPTTAFRMDSSGTITTLHVFQGTDGGNLQAPLVQASDGNFYGTTELGSGGSGFGTVFRMDVTGGVTTLHTFDYTDGAYPYAGLVQAADGFLYGTTVSGGSNGPGCDGCGTVFKIGTTGDFTDLHNFEGSAGSSPSSSLLPASGGLLYGTTSFGGDCSTCGTIFSVDGGGNFSTIHAFVGNDGASPRAALIQDAGGHQYGTTESGGAHGLGSVFRLESDGSVTTLASFGDAEGANPKSSLVMAANGAFYGTTTAGAGPSGSGAVFAMDSSGSLTMVHSFDQTAGCPVDANRPYSSLIQATDGALYGTTCRTSNPIEGGSTYKIDTAGTFTQLHTFGFGDGGIFPVAPLLQAEDGQLYGTLSSGFCSGGGGDGCGAAFKMNAFGDVTSLHHFNAADGAYPEGPLVQASDGDFYGTTAGCSQPGSAGCGTASAFKMDSSGQLTPLRDFVDGDFVNSPLLQAPDGNVYGSVLRSSSSAGFVFKMDSAGNLTPLHIFAGPDGSGPSALLLAADGNLYGTTSAGGATGFGNVFEVTPDGSFTTLHDFMGPDGATPYAPLIQTADGSLYGTASAGGTENGGVIFRLVPCGIAQPPVITTSSCLAANTPGLKATASGSPDDIYQWTIVGGSITDGQGTPTVTFTSADPGTRMSVRVIEVDGSDCVGAASVAAQVDFADVGTADPFYPYVCAIGRDAITAGCGSGDYCRDNPVRRDQMAVFLLKAEHGSTYSPPGCIGAFQDVPCPGPFTNWIEQLASEGITSGCGGGDYCPSSPVNREQMAVFLLKAEHGSTYTPPPCSGIFGDVVCPSQFADWIEQLASEHVTGGCGNDDYCPDDSVTRGQMAVFLVKTFGLQ